MLQPKSSHWYWAGRCWPTETHAASWQSAYSITELDIFPLQIEGSFIQGMGLYTTEELKYSPEGVLYSRGPDDYKIPTITDVPVEFNVSLLSSSHTPLTIYSSKVSNQIYYCTMWWIRQHNKWKQVDKIKNKCQPLLGPNQDRLLESGDDSSREIQRFREDKWSTQWQSWAKKFIY